MGRISEAVTTKTNLKWTFHLLAETIARIIKEQAFKQKNKKKIKITSLIEYLGA